MPYDGILCGRGWLPWHPAHSNLAYPAGFHPRGRHPTTRAPQAPPVPDSKTDGRKRDKNSSKDGQWRSFPNVPHLLQYVSNGNYYGKSKSAARLLATPVPFRHRLFLLGDFYSPVNNPGMRELKDTGVLLLGFLPWLLFLFFSGHSMESLERISWVCLAASLTFGFGELRSGYILQWGTLCFFTGCVVFVGLLHVVWVATHMDLLANASLAGIIWATLFAGRPFALQYARKDLPKERWNDPRLLEGCRFITLVWAMLMSVSVGISVYRRIPVPQASEQIYFAISLATIASGVIFTTLFKRQKRLQREKLARSDSLS